MQIEKLQNILEALLISAEKPLSIDKLLGFFQTEDLVNRNDVKQALALIQKTFEARGFELIETASGFRFQTKSEYKQWVTQHWDEKPARYSRALLETLALIVYRQPITRAEIEDIRGVAVSSNIIKTLQERDWIRVVGHKEVPGRPALLGTTRQFLDYFNLKSLDEMPSLSEIQDIDKLYPELDLGPLQDLTEAADEQEREEEEDEHIEDKPMDIFDIDEIEINESSIDSLNAKIKSEADQEPNDN
ncbi:SMC-Scp complex subunit ScpB [Cocleimonas sp. KMM 6892]|uniref:SMC-Scp complex subunit ScpB n=1 Tax=unclassified Cocleimonas TaxID=2639732 RepID=UPI002DB72648|nr:MULTISPECIES: SMC-Scp complex subunit ScpB [unclassified Cocleimonas]MEB8433010.1 SMC-Scp complex subunit ScpB [Cocleimonas sp. KMM 6892]MEC4716009.1 SMC-Scp complex subunit ScpB [Cocleimonas sp. KMM 6895]MEC4745470.1 SMC-Scp complex subunit ScpB [Cocleimonas sp. KMM 6896]